MIISLKKSTPTDAEYLQAFRENNSAMITQFLRENRGLFMGTIKKKFTIKIDGAYNEIYQDTLYRFYENVYANKVELFQDSRLINYIIGIGIFASQEYIRKHEKLINIIQQEEQDREDGIENEYVDMSSVDSVDQSFKPITKTPTDVWKESQWIHSVEEPYEKYVLEGHTHAECIDEWMRLAEAFEKTQKKKSPSSQLPDAADYRAAIIEEVVDKMGKPCAPLLKLFYWEKKSWTDIAQELPYSGADSAKTQKNKCMGKLKVLVTNQLKKVAL